MNKITTCLIAITILLCSTIQAKTLVADAGIAAKPLQDCKTDLRYLNEALFVKNQQGYIVRVVRPGATTTVHNSHTSEIELSDYIVDKTIINDGTLEDLKKKIIEYYETLIDKKEYM